MAQRLRSSALALLILPMASPVRAHPRDELGQASYVGITRKAITVELSLAPGDQLAPSFAALEEKPDFAQRVLGNLTLSLDGKRLALRLVREPLRTPEQSTKLFMEAPLVSLSAGAHTLHYENRYAPFKSGYLATTLAGTDGITIGTQTHGAFQQTLTVAFQAPATGYPLFVWIVASLLALAASYGAWGRKKSQNLR
ncbi:hypothetical protein [Armatimonas sp.]|uniref:hypothetical protein n=1 Tax=Armatimonas sp. TaxID=1872638 RepID=UPI0037533D03